MEKALYLPASPFAELSLLLGYIPPGTREQLFRVIIRGPARGDGIMRTLCLKCHAVSSKRFFSWESH